MPFLAAAVTHSEAASSGEDLIVTPVTLPAGEILTETRTIPEDFPLHRLTSMVAMPVFRRLASR